METEIVFEILGEGGGISIIRQRSKSDVKFIYHHGEFDPTDEGLAINIKDEYDNFEQPFQLINNRYPWYTLHIETVHYDYRKYIIDKLLEKLNEKSIDPKYMDYSKRKLEHALNIELTCKLKDNKPIWSYMETNEK